MASVFLSEKNVNDLDLDFVFDRLQVVTPYGTEAKRAMRPYGKKESATLAYQLHLLEHMVERFTNKRHDVLDLKNTFKEVKQLGGTFDRLEAGETLSVTELFEMKHLAFTMNRIREHMSALHWEQTVSDYELKSTIPVLELLDPEGSGVNNFHIYSSYSQALYDIRSEMLQIEKAMKAHVSETIEALAHLGIKAGLGGEVRIRQSDTAHIEAAKQSPLLYYRTDIPMYSLFKIKMDDRLEQALEALKVREDEEEFVIRTELSLALSRLTPLMRYNAGCIGAIDLLIAKAQFATAFHCVKPVMRTGETLVIKGAKHLKVAYGLERSGQSFTPLDVTIHAKVSLITGANMGGKTVSLRTIGQIVAMAHYGLFVPAESAEIYPMDFLFISVGDAQSVDMGLSTFGAEIITIGSMLKRMDESGLILIDELARGTNPREGYAISKALIEHLCQGQAKAIITTHYDGLTSGEGVAHYQVNGLTGLDFETIKDQIGEKGMSLLHAYMDYRLTEVSQNRAIPKEALRIAQIMGLAPEIINRAKAILGGSHDE